MTSTSSSCIHLLPHLVDRASDIVLARQKDGTNYGDLMQCAHCDRVGNLCDVRYYEHFVGSHHHVCVRLQSPVELYCCICGDFQYSHSFDGKVNRKRQRSAPASAYSLLVPPPRKPSAASPSKSSASLPASYPSSSASAPLRTTGSSSSSSSSSANDSASQLSAEDEAVATALLGGMQRVLMRRGNASSGGSSDMTRSPRGICNMGSTCFMGSVLQVMLNNPLLQARREMQMTFSEPYNKGCSKAAHAVAASQVSSSSSSSETSSSSSSSSSAGLLSCISDGCIACELRCLFGEAADDPSHHPASIIPSNLLYSVWIFAEYMAGYDQQDAHEFLIALLDGLAQHLERYHKQEPPSSSAVKTANGAGAGAGAGAGGGVVDLTCSSDSASNGSSSSSGNGMVSQVFLGVLHSRVVCMSCGNSSSKQDPILDVSLSLESVGWGNAEAGIDLTGASKDPFAPISLRDCLRFFTSKETLSERVACGRCNQHCPAQKSLSFAVAPHTLVLHLKRFDAINQRKIHTKVLFDLEGFDLTEFMLSEGHSTPAVGKKQQQQQQHRERVVYDLTGMVTHKGSLNTGHYISYVCSQTAAPDAASANGNVVRSKQWMRCDDENVVPVPPSEVQAAEAYILFYIKRGIQP